VDCGDLNNRDNKIFSWFQEGCHTGRGPAPSLRRPGAGRVRRLQGWPEGIGDEDILKSLLALNPERSARQGKVEVRLRAWGPQAPRRPGPRGEHVGRIVAPALRPAHHGVVDAPRRRCARRRRAAVTVGEGSRTSGSKSRYAGRQPHLHSPPIRHRGVASESKKGAVFEKTSSTRSGE